MNSSCFHILIVKHGALGDVVRTSYFAAALRKKYGERLRLSWVTAPSSLPLLRFNPHIDDLWTSYEECKAHQFDHVYSLEDEKNIIENVCRLKFLCITGAILDPKGSVTYTDDSAVWFDMGLISRLGKEKADELKKRNTRSHADIFSQIFEVTYPRPEFWGSNKYKGWVDACIGRNGSIIGVNPFAGGRWPSKELPLHELKSMCDILLKRLLAESDTLVLLGASDDRLKNRKLAEEIGDPRIWIPDTDDSILRFASVIASLDYLITSDSLALHLGIAQNIPFAAFFAPTSAVEIDDFGLGVKISSSSVDYCSYRKDTDNSSLTAGRILEAITAHRNDFFGGRGNAKYLNSHSLL